MIEVQSPPGSVVGYVKEEPCGICRTRLSIQNADEEIVLNIKCPTLGCSGRYEDDFIVRL